MKYIFWGASISPNEPIPGEETQTSHRCILLETNYKFTSSPIYIFKRKQIHSI